jgi:site-specific recombinase XerD
MAESALATHATLEVVSYTNPAAVYLAGLAATGRRTMMGALSTIAGILGAADLWAAPWEMLRYEHVALVRTTLSERGLAAATVNKHLAALRGVMRAAWRMGLVDADTYERIADVDLVTGSTLPAGRALGPGEIAAIMRACADGTPAGARDAAIIALAYAGGLRRAELAALALGDVLDDGEDATHGGAITLKVLGKRNKERLVYLDNGAAMALRAWLTVRGGAAGALFYAGRRGGHILAGQGLTSQAVFEIVTRRAEQAGIAHASPHDLRRSFVGDLLDAGVDIATVAAMAGHASVNTTARYDRRGEQAKKRAAGSLHVPFYGK